MTARYELADFDPSEGHLHTCPRTARARSECDCAAHLFCIAQDLSIAVTDLRREVRLRERQS